MWNINSLRDTSGTVLCANAVLSLCDLPCMTAELVFLLNFRLARSALSWSVITCLPENAPPSNSST